MKIIVLVALLIWSTVGSGRTAWSAGLCLFGCVDAEVNTKDFVKASENLVEAMKQFARFDPLGVQTLLSKNAELQAKVESARSQLSGYVVATPVILLEGQQLRFTIVQAFGGFQIDAFLDSEENMILHNVRVTDGTYQLSLPSGDVAIAPIINVIRRQPGFGHKQPSDIDVTLDLVARAVDAQNGVAQKAFANFLSTVQPFPNPPPNSWDLNQILETEGVHRLSVRITPLSYGQVGRWALRGVLHIKRAGAEDLILKQFDVSSEISPSHRLGTQLPVETLRFVAKSKATQ